MFTIDQIREAHAKVKTGADFPRYAQELKALGLRYYHNYVADGHTEYFGENGYTITGPAKYPEMPVAGKSDKKAFEAAMKHHQQGGSDYLTLCRQAAGTGVEKWTVDLEKMTCTYYNRSGEVLLVEEIPEP